VWNRAIQHGTIKRGRDVEDRIPVDRRDFLKATGVLTGVLALGSPLALIAPSRAWAADLRAFTSAEGATLMAMARTIAPHDKLEDAAYAIVIQNIDAEAVKDELTLKLMREGSPRSESASRWPPRTSGWKR
jgi:hypothetical protein